MPSVRIYDTIQNENLKYVSAVLQLRANYLEEEDDYEQLNALTDDLIYARLPKETFTGRLKYMYREGGEMQIRTIRIGTVIKPKNDRQ